MDMHQMECPKPRGNLRLICGSAYYRIRRKLELQIQQFRGIRFAVQKQEQELPVLSFSHSTPLYRKLKNVDMQLQRNKAVNLKIAAARINGVLLYPGEVFSYWKLIGNPVKRKGYLPGMQLYYGSYRPGIGGGLCQLSNLIYWMTLHTPLTVIQRHRHSYDVFPDADRTQPFGSGATCHYNYMDLCIRNDTPYIFQLCVDVGETRLLGAWRTEVPPVFRYQVYEAEHWISSEYWGGYSRHNVLRRKVFKEEDTEVADEYITENHALMMYAPLLQDTES